MKKLLFISLFFVCKSQAQITTTGIFGSSSNNSDAASYDYISVTYSSSETYLLIVYVTGATTDGEVTVSANTWEFVASTGNSTRRIVMFYCANPTGITETITYGNFGSTGTNCRMIVYRIKGAVKNISAVLQNAVSSGSGADPSLSLAALESNRSMAIAAFMNDINPFGGTAEVGWVSRLNNGNTTPNMGSYAQDQTNGIDNTATVTAAASNWIGLAIEIKSAERRRIRVD